MKKIGISLFLVMAAVVAFAQDAATWKSLEKPLNFYLANDLGRNGYYDQKPIAELMGKMAETIDIEFVVAAGDVHHFEGGAQCARPFVDDQLRTDIQPSRFDVALVSHFRES